MNISITSRLLTSFPCLSDEYLVETFSEFSSEIFGSLQKSLEMIGNVGMNFGLLSDNFGADFVSFWMKFTVTVNFLLLVLKCLKFNCFMLQRPKLSVKCYRGTPIQTL